MDATCMLQISRKPDVSFLHANGEEIGRRKVESTEGQDRGQIPPIYFVVAGSGKTQSIFDHLAADWGYYYISGRIPDSPSHTDSILGSCHGGASADTQWLYKLFKRLKSETDRLPYEGYYLAIQLLLAPGGLNNHVDPPDEYRVWYLPAAVSNDLHSSL